MTYTRTINGKKYLYKSVRVGKKVKGIYLGKETSRKKPSFFLYLLYIAILLYIIVGMTGLIGLIVDKLCR